MKISKSQLQKIIAEEVREHVKKKLMKENKKTRRTVRATPSMLKRIIAEEASKVNEMADFDGEIKRRVQDRRNAHAAEGKSFGWTNEYLCTEDGVTYKTSGQLSPDELKVISDADQLEMDIDAGDYSNEHLDELLEAKKCFDRRRDMLILFAADSEIEALRMVVDKIKNPGAYPDYAAHREDVEDYY